MAFPTFLQVLFSGLAMGAIYTLSAKGLFITHLATHRLNFGQGDFLMVGAFLSMTLLLAGVPVVLTIATVLAVLAVMGWLLERLAIRPLDRVRHHVGGAFSWVLTTMGVALILQNAATLVWGGTGRYSPPIFSADRDNVVYVLGAGLFVEEVVVVLMSLAIVGGFYWFLFKTKWGREINAVAFSPETSALLGINVQRTVILVFVLAAVLAGISGVLVGPLVTVHPHMGLVFTIKALAVAAIGGFSHPFGILLGGVLFGIAESFANYFDSAFGDLYPLLFLIAFLILRPSGLFGEAKTDVR